MMPAPCNFVKKPLLYQDGVKLSEQKRNQTMFPIVSNDICRKKTFSLKNPLDYDFKS